MVMHHTPTIRTCRSLRMAFVAAAALALLMPTLATAAGRGHRARLSRDLETRLWGGDASETRVIVAGSSARIDALAARHGLRVVRRLATGAVLRVPPGRLRQLADDDDID